MICEEEFYSFESALEAIEAFYSFNLKQIESRASV